MFLGTFIKLTLQIAVENYFSAIFAKFFKICIISIIWVYTWFKSMLFLWISISYAI